MTEINCLFNCTCKWLQKATLHKLTVQDVFQAELIGAGHGVQFTVHVACTISAYTANINFTCHPRLSCGTYSTYSLRPLTLGK